MDPGAQLTKAVESDQMQYIGIDKTKYQMIIGSIMFVMLGSRPDIAYSISKLAQFSNNLTEKHCKALRQLLRYIATTIDYQISYQPSHVNNNTLQLVGCSDSNWGTHWKIINLQLVTCLF